MSSLDVTGFAAMLKTIYPDEEVETAAFQNTLFAKRLKKIDDMYGDDGGGLRSPIQIASGAGRSRTFATAQTNATPGLRAAWVLHRKTDYAVYQVTAETLKASSRDVGAFVPAFKAEMDLQLLGLGQSFSRDVYGDGSLGVIATGGISASTITLKYATDTKNFFKNQKIQLSATTSGGAVKAGGPLTVASVSASAGTVTFTAGVVATIGTAAAGDFVFVDGDYGLSLNGLKSWIPLVAPGATLFNGVDRTQDIERLAGFRLDNPNGDPGENLLTVGQQLAMGSPNPNSLIVLVNPIHYGAIMKTLQSKVFRANNEKTDVIGSNGVKVALSCGIAEVIADPDCPGGQGWILDESVVEFHSMGAVPHISMEDGNESLRVANADSVEVRARYWGDLLIRNPHKCATFSTPV